MEYVWCSADNRRSTGISMDKIMIDKIRELLDCWSERSEYQRNFKESVFPVYREGVADGIEYCMEELKDILYL